MMQIDETKRIGQQSRPYLLRRGAGAPGGGSFKRRSLKLRRGTKEGRDMEVECEYAINCLNCPYFIQKTKLADRLFQGKFLTQSKGLIRFSLNERLVPYQIEATLLSLVPLREVKKNLLEC